MKIYLLLLLLALISLSDAYITDIKIVSCDSKYACPNYPGYRKIPIDLNLGVKDAKSIFVHLKEDPKEDPITDLQIIQGKNDTHVSNIFKWTKLKINLNEQNHNDDDLSSLWLYYTKDKSISKNPVTSVIVKQGTSPSISAEYKRISIDLNKDVGGQHLFMYYSQDGPKDPITAITAKQCFTSNCYIEGWERVEKDLNKGIIVGMNIYLFYKRSTTEDPITDVVAILNDQTPPEGYTKVNVNLNSIFRGDSIYLWYKTTPSSDLVNIEREALQELAIEFGNNPVTPFDWTKININLNSANNGKDGFGEPTYLFLKKGYQELPKVDRLYFDKNGEFKILQLADLHFTNKEGVCRDIPLDMDCKGDMTTLKYIEDILDREKPNLVVFSGDNINGDGVSDARAATFKFAEPVIQRKIPWAVIFGTNDDKNDLSREELIEVMRRMPYSLTEYGPFDIPGVGNYIVKVYSNNTKTAAHDFTIYFLDSHAYSDDGNEDEYDYIKPDQLNWVVQSASAFKNLSSKPNAMAFFHIPIWEYHEEAIDVNNKRIAKLGDAREKVSSPKKNKISALQAFKTAGDIKVTSCGHNHVNDYCLERENIQLCYGGGAGVGGYGAEHLGWPRRARVFKIRNYGNIIETWKRQFTNNLPLFHFQTLYTSSED